VVAHWSNTFNTVWDFTPNPELSQYDSWDSFVMMYYNTREENGLTVPKTLPAGET
jgi:hypothetical protein